MMEKILEKILTETVPHLEERQLERLKNVLYIGCCTKLTHFLLIAIFEAGYNELFVYINTTTIVVNFIHNGASVDEFTARNQSVVILLYVLLPQMAGQMVVPSGQAWRFS